MSHAIDLSILDRPKILRIAFHPRKDSSRPFSLCNSSDYFIEVEKGIDIGCRFYHSNPENPSLIYFHGNAETVSDHNDIASIYSQRRINLFVPDYRGYGLSNGKPTITNMFSDAHVIFQRFKQIIEQEGCKGSLFIMGRSLGSMPAIDLTLHYQNEIRGLIIESGSANNFRRPLSRLGVYFYHPIWEEKQGFLNKVKIRSIHIPTLIIHAEYDRYISLQEGKELYENSGAEEKTMLIISKANHYNLMEIGKEQYFHAIEEFITTSS